ncbi:MAG: hypothetical protein PHW87_05045 [Methanothrix sp.]|nr:hypothetical protein [Methanothrix sp.]
MRGMRERRKEKTGLDMIKPTSFYSSEIEKVKLNWFCYELSLSIYDSIRKKLAARLKRRKISNEALADFSIYYAKGMKDVILQQLSGKIEKVCISYEPIESYFPNIGDEMINKMTDTISEAWDEMLSFCEVCPNRCISEKDAFCTLFDDNHLFD